MVGFTISAGSFPDGATVDAYLASGWVPEGTPSGSPVASATANADGSVPFTGLTAGTAYYAYSLVGSEHRYIRFSTDAAASGGGGGVLDWCKFELSNCPSFSASGTQGYLFAEADITIDQQQGSNFSISDDGSNAILAAEAGWYQFGLYFSPPYNGVTLDPSGTDPRWLAFAALTGAPGSPLRSWGIDLLVPITEEGWASSAAVTVPSMPNFVEAGGPAVANINLNALGLTGTDELTDPGSSVSSGLAAWRIG